MEHTFGKIVSDTLDELHRIIQYGPTNDDRLVAAELILDTYRHVSDSGMTGDVWIPDEWDK
jgi:hypothetical protein